MPITYHCECGEAIPFPDDRAGEEEKCPKCSRRFQVPGAVPGEESARSGNGKAKLIGALAIGLIVLVAAILALRPFAPGRPAPPEELRAIPAGVTALGGVNVDKLRRSEQFGEFTKMLRNEPDYARLNEAGISLESVQSLYFAVDIAEQSETGEPSVLALIRNSAPVDLDKLASAIEAGEEATVEKTTLDAASGPHGAYLVAHPQRNQTIALTTLNGNLLVAGTKSLVTRAVDLSAGEGESVASNARLMKLAENGARSESFWLTADLPKEQMREIGQQITLGPVRLEQIESALVSVDAGPANGIVLGLSLVCESEPVAEAALPALQATVLNMAQLFLQIDADAFAFSREAERVSMRVDLSREAIEGLVVGAFPQPAEPGAEPWPQEVPAPLPESDEGDPNN